MEYLVYFKHNAEKLQFFLWYKHYVRRFEALPENEKVLSPEWIPETTEIPDLSKGTEKESRKAKRKAVGTMMETGYDCKGAALFSEDRERLPSQGRHMSFDRKNGNVAVPSILESAAISNAESAQSGLKWQPCMSTNPSHSTGMTSLIDHLRSQYSP
jgi:hypothetical protein